MALIRSLAGAALILCAGAATAQFTPPPPGSAEGTESGTYGSRSGFDVRGTGTVDRYGRPQDPLNPTDTARKPVDPRDARNKPDADADRIPVPLNARTPGDTGNAAARPSTAPGGRPSASGAGTTGGAGTGGSGTGGASPGQGGTR